MPTLPAMDAQTAAVLMAVLTFLGILVNNIFTYLLKRQQTVLERENRITREVLAKKTDKVAEIADGKVTAVLQEVHKVVQKQDDAMVKRDATLEKIEEIHEKVINGKNPQKGA